MPRFWPAFFVTAEHVLAPERDDAQSAFAGVLVHWHVHIAWKELQLSRLTKRTRCSATAKQNETLLSSDVECDPPGETGENRPMLKSITFR
jgi:hypothetical protein